MSELSSLLFVDTDELGRPTGLIASEETDTLASALLPQDVKDTVEIVKVADVSANYPGWNTVSGVSGLADISATLTALPGDFDNLEASVAYVSTVVDSIDPTAINGVSSTVLDNSGFWQGTYLYTLNASDNIADTSTTVIGVDSGLSALAASSSELSTAIDNIPIGGEVAADVSNNWQGTYLYTLNASDNLADTSAAVIGVDSGLSALATSSSELSTAIDNIPVGGEVPADVSNNWQDTYGFTSGASGVIEDGSGVLSGLSGSIAGTTDGPDVPIFSALSAIADRLRVVDDLTRIDALSGQTIVLSGASKITSRAGTMSVAGANDGSFLKLQPSIGYVSALSAGLVAPPGGDIIIAREAQGAATITSSLLGLYQTNDDNSGGWQDSYIYVDSASGNIESVSGSVLDGSSTWNDASGVSGVSSVVSSVIDSVDADTITLTDKQLKLFAQKPIVNGDESVKLTLATAADGALTLEAGSQITLSSTQFAIRDSANTKTFTQPEFVAGLDAGADRPNVIVVSGLVQDASTVLTDISGVDKQLSAQTLTILGNGDINIGPDTGDVSSLIPIIADLASVSGTGGGGGSDTSAASAIIVPGGAVYAINTAGSPSNDTTLVLSQDDQEFSYQAIVFKQDGNQIVLGDQVAGDDFNLSGTNNFVTSGSTKTFLEFDDKSRIALGRATIPLEISALSGADIDIGKDSTVNFDGSSVVTFEHDSTYGPLILIKGADVDASANTRMHFNNAELSANAETQIDIDADITLGAAAHLDGNTLGAIHIACKNTQGTSVSGGTPVYITGNVGGSNKIEIGVASASVASSMPAVGILSEDLADDAEGYVDAFGIASKLDTSLFASGDTLYVAPTGGLTNTRPSAATDLVQNIGIVELSDSSNGKIIVLGPGRTNDVPNSFTIKSNYTIDDGDNGHLFYVDLEDSGKKSQMLMNPTVPSILVQANDTGGGNVTAFTVGSTNLNLQFTGTSDLRVNNDSGTSGQVLTSDGTGNAPTWKYPNEDRVQRWLFTDFHNRGANNNDPFVGAAFGSGGNSTGNPASFQGYGLQSDGIGWAILRTGTGADSGYRWDTAHPQTLVVSGLTHRAIFNTLDFSISSNLIAQFGFGNNNISSPYNSQTHAAMWRLEGGTLSGFVKQSSGNEDSFSALTLEHSTTYMTEMRFENNTSATFTLRSKPNLTTGELGTVLAQQTLELTGGAAWGEGVGGRIGAAAWYDGTAPGNNTELIALDYQGIGFPNA